MRDKDVRKFIDDADPLNNFKKRGFGNEAYRGRDGRNQGNNRAGKSYEQVLREKELARKAFRS